MNHRPSAAWALIRVACCAALLTTACSVTVPGQAGPASPQPAASPQRSASPPEKGNPMTNPLSGRPLSADAVTTYTRMQEELRTAITAAVLTVVWAPIRDQLNAGCGGKLSGLNGRTVFLQPWATEGSVTVEQWPTVVAAMVPVAAAYKFTGPRAARVAGSEFRSEFQGPYGALLELSSFKAMVMMVQTGCHPES